MPEESPGPGAPDPDRTEPRIGPDPLHGPNPTPPQLVNGPGWDADPLLASGCEAYVDGEYLYQDYVYDDHGADTLSVFDQPPEGHTLGGFYCRPTGDYRYPSDGDTYAYNAADLLEFRARPTDDGVAYRITLNTMLQPDTAAVAVGIDRRGPDADGEGDGTGADVASSNATDDGEPADGQRTDWGYGLGELGAPVDHRLVTWGTGAELDGEPLPDGAVDVDVERNQIELEVPLEPGAETWRHYLVVGLWDDDEHAFQQIELDADGETPGGRKEGQDVPPVFNVGFRFEEPMDRNVDLDTLLPRLATILVNAPTDAIGDLDDPLELLGRVRDLPGVLGDVQASLNLLDPLDSPLNPLSSGGLSDLVDELDRFMLFSDTDGVPRVLGEGNWHEHRQATALALRDLSGFHADVDFGALREGLTDRRIPESGHLTLLYPSRHDFGDGVDPFENVLLGRIQPYGVYVPEDVQEPAPTVTMLHSLGNCYTQYPVWMPGYVEGIGETCGAVVLMPQSRGPGIWFKHDAALDLFEAWRDLRTRFDLDRTRSSVTGYSMGGFGALMMATKHPDCFGRCFPVVGPPAEDPLEAPTNDLLATPSLVMHELLGGEGGGRLFTIFNEEPENALRLTENLRHVPTLMWHGGTDALVPLLGPTNYAQRLRSHGYRHQIDVFPTVDHFFLAIRDRWDRGPEYLADAEIPTNPARVTYRRVPEFDYPDIDLVHDGAHWVQEIEPREGVESGLVDAVTLAEGYAEPVPERYTTSGTRPLPYTGTGLRWREPGSVSGNDADRHARGPANALELDLEGVGSVTVWIEAAGLDPAEPLTVEASSDGAATLHLRGSFGTETVAIEAGDSTVEVEPLR